MRTSRRAQRVDVARATYCPTLSFVFVPHLRSGRPVAVTWDNRDICYQAHGVVKHRQYIHGQYGFFRQRRGESRF
jgi:hypothetical protein